MKFLSEISAERLAFLVGALIVLVLIISVTSCTVSANNRSAELLSKGVSAVEINCAINFGQDMESACSKAIIK